MGQPPPRRPPCSQVRLRLVPQKRLRRLRQPPAFPTAPWRLQPTLSPPQPRRQRFYRRLEPLPRRKRRPSPQRRLEPRSTAPLHGQPPPPHPPRSKPPVGLV